MDYADALRWLDGRINYETRGMPPADDLRLDRERRLLSALGDPHRKYKVVHIAGTKGKGSTAYLLAALVMSAGQRVGLHTSPHFDRLEERFRIDGALLPESEVATLLTTVRDAALAVEAQAPDQPELTFFEITTAVMFLAFARAAVDWAVVEVGMGGRLDCTNVVDPAACVITSIGLDHTKQLGHTLELIAAEKAGIIKPGVPVFCGISDPGPRAVVRRVVQERGCPLFEINGDINPVWSSRDVSGGTLSLAFAGHRVQDLRLGLVGKHQAANAALALATAWHLATTDVLPMVDPAALSAVRIPARVEVVQQAPVCVIVDAAHNVPSIAALILALADLTLPAGPRVLVFAASRDKDAAGMLKLAASAFSDIIVTEYTNNPRAVPADQLKDLCTSAIAVADPVAAWHAACKVISLRQLGRWPTGTICVTGSFFLAAQLRELAKCPVSGSQSG